MTSFRHVVTAAAVALIGGGAVGAAIGAAPATATGGGEACAREHYEWSGEVKLASFNPEFDTGIIIPPPADGETVQVLDVSYIARNLYPDLDPDHTRAIDDQQHESFALFIGDIQVGGLTPDLPDSVDEGAPSDWFSGDQVGSFGGGATTGGAVVLRHAYLFGFDESANSIDPQLISLDVDRCTIVEESTTTTEPPTTTIPVAPPTDATVPTTVPVEVTTTVTTIPTTVATTAPVQTTTTTPILVATGRTSGWIVGAGGASVLSGLSLLRLRRRGRPED